MKRPVSLDKLSRLQRLILVALLEPRYASLSRRRFRDLIKLLYWGSGYSRAAVIAASLSRSLTALESRGYLVRTRRGWTLSTSALSMSDPANFGLMMALRAWQQKKELYLQVGLGGPTS